MRYIKYFDKFDKSKFNLSGENYYIHNSIFLELLEGLIQKGYEILGYDGMIINDKGTLGPLSLIFDFSRKNYLAEERNKRALENIPLLRERATNEGYNLDNLFIDVVARIPQKITIE